MDACAQYLAVKNRRLSFEWAMIADTNDRERDAMQLAELARALRAHVNLIPLNPTPGYPVVGSSPERVREFRDTLRERGVNATIRANRGTDIDAACGQLRAAHEIALKVPTRRR
jgi:23S rRNA (adenine2503-C2)-methyltransferase